MTNPGPTSDNLTARAFREADGTADWPVLSNGATTFFPTDSLGTSSKLVAAIAALEGIEAHRPYIDIRNDGVTVRLLTMSSDWWGMSQRDVALARRISAAATALGLKADGTIVQSVEPIVIGAVDIAKVRPFWQALFDYIHRPDSPEEDLVDPRGIGPGIWFETVETPVVGRNRLHTAVWVPYEQAEARLAAVIAAGGRVIYDEFAPAWWTLSDPEGNEADLATIMYRD